MPGFVPVIQQLHRQPVGRPVHPRRSRCDPGRQWTFIADRKLHQHMRQFAYLHVRAGKTRRFAKHPDPGEHAQLNGKRADGEEDKRKRKLQDERKTVHGDRSGPYL
jgi:hypothetical protein